MQTVDGRILVVAFLTANWRYGRRLARVPDGLGGQSEIAQLLPTFVPGVSRLPGKASKLDLVSGYRPRPDAHRQKLSDICEQMPQTNPAH